MAKKTQQKIQIRAIVKFYELILTFDSALPNDQIEKQAADLVEAINLVLKNQFKDTIPQLSSDSKKRPKISVTPFNPDDYSDD